MARVDAHSFGDDASRPFHKPPVVPSRVGQLERSLVDAFEPAGSQLIAAVKEVTELVVAVAHLTPDPVPTGWPWPSTIAARGRQHGGSTATLHRTQLRCWPVMVEVSRSSRSF
jgi:hypothetical protein